ncbi:hypothetical protein GX51_00399 [Blastomyces parvus]|uniref:Uncharacterized protein n=1 Tax=Blastomyces parvus TaxID=2060905 RepID=A0A2B7XLA1_9EURO|nr:hypothetical protein GX51_00399 [Blastomyces parvus]
MQAQAPKKFARFKIQRDTIDEKQIKKHQTTAAVPRLEHPKRSNSPRPAIVPIELLDIYSCAQLGFATVAHPTSSLSLAALLP